MRSLWSREPEQLPLLKTRSWEWAASLKVRPKFERHSPQYIVHDRPVREETIRLSSSGQIGEIPQLRASGPGREPVSGDGRTIE